MYYLQRTSIQASILAYADGRACRHHDNVKKMVRNDKARKKEEAEERTLRKEAHKDDEEGLVNSLAAVVRHLKTNYDTATEVMIHRMTMMHGADVSRKAMEAAETPKECSSMDLALALRLWREGK